MPAAPAATPPVAAPDGRRAANSGPAARPRGLSSRRAFRPAATPPVAAPDGRRAATGGVAAGAAGMPFLGGMGVGAGGQSTEHRNTYWVRSAEPFDVPLPPHGDAVLHGGDA